MLSSMRQLILATDGNPNRLSYLQYKQDSIWIFFASWYTFAAHRYLKGQRSLKNIFQYRARSANPVRILLYFQLESHLVSPGVQVHDEVLGLGVPVAHLALVAVRVPRHLLRLVLVLPANAIIIKDYAGLG